MKYSRLLFLLPAFSLALFFLGCASRPDELIQQTEAARQEAKDAYADQFALEDWSAAEKAWGQAADSLQKEDYGQAYTHLLNAKTRYTKARDLATSNKEEAVKKIEQNKLGASIRLKNLRESGAKLPASRRKELEARCDELEAQLGQIDAHIKNGEFTDADLLAQKSFRAVYEAEQEFIKK